MAEYIDKEHLLTEYCSEDERTWDNGLWYIEHEPTANVVEREKIDKAIEEIESLFEESLNECPCTEMQFRCGLTRAIEILEKNEVYVRNIGE